MMHYKCKQLYESSLFMKSFFFLEKHVTLFGWKRPLSEEKKFQLTLLRCHTYYAKFKCEYLTNVSGERRRT